MNKLLASSSNPEKLATTVKGILLGLIPLILIISGLTGVDVTQIELTNLVEAIGTMVTAGLIAVSSVMTVFGLVRKIWIKLRG